MTQKIFYASLLLLLVHHLTLVLFVFANVEGLSLSKPPSPRQRSRRAPTFAQEQNRNSGLQHHNQFVVLTLANHTQRITNHKNTTSMNGTLDGSTDHASNSTTSKDELMNIESSIPIFKSSGKAVEDIPNVSAHHRTELVPRTPLIAEVNFESQISNSNETNSKPLVILGLNLTRDGIEKQSKHRKHSIPPKRFALTNIASEDEDNTYDHQSSIILTENSETNSGEFVPSSCQAVLGSMEDELKRKETLMPKKLGQYSFNSNITRVQRNEMLKAPQKSLPPGKEEPHEPDGMARWTCLPPEPLSASKSFDTPEICCCTTIDVFWSAYNAERAEFKNHTVLWDDLCTYYNATKTIVCSGSQVIEVPTLKTTIAEVNTIIFDNTKIESLEEQAATEKLPKSHGLGFTNGALRNVNSGFLAKIRTNQLTLANNSLSVWNFSWFESDIPSNITSINLEFNSIKFLPSPIVGPEFVLPHLHSLTLSDNPLLVIPPDLFRPLAYSPVKCLGLRNCCLEDFGNDKENGIASSLKFLPYLEVLDLSMNPNLASYKIARFLSPLRGRRLRTLVLSSNGYMNVPYTALETVSSSLVELDLHSSSLLCLDNTSFPYLPELRKLNLDFCRISSLLPGVFDSTPVLESLSLQGNHFVNIPPAVRLPTLKGLNFKGNPRIEDEHEDCAFSLEKDSFRGMTGLEDLNLAETPLQRIETGQFYGMRALRTLTLTRSLIRSIQPGAFASLENLHSLYLNSNLLEFLDNNSFAGLNNLAALNLDHNEITLTRPYPSPLSPVLGIELHTQKKRMEGHVNAGPPDAHSHSPPHSEKDDPETELSFSTSARPFSTLKKLQILSLASNRIGELIPVFDDLETLIHLDLSQNVVYDWTKRVFQYNPNLSKLDLQDNQLSSFTDAMIQDFTNENLTEIDIGLNPFSCTCSLYDALEELNVENFVHYNEYTCTVEDTFPEQQRLFTDAHEECSNLDTPEDVNGSTTGIVFLVMGILVFVTCAIAATFALRRKLRKNEESTDTKRDEFQMKISHQYDVFICYAATDKSWVFYTLLPVFEEEFCLQVCVHERDFEPGDMIVENISSSVTKSRKVLFVVSPAFVSSPWCRMELDFTRMSSINEGTNKLIVLQKEAVPYEDQPQVLRYILSTRTYIEWAEDTQVQALAWTKLRKVLTQQSVDITTRS